MGIEEIEITKRLSDCQVIMILSELTKSIHYLAKLRGETIPKPVDQLYCNFDTFEQFQILLRYETKNSRITGIGIAIIYPTKLSEGKAYHRHDMPVTMSRGIVPNFAVEVDYLTFEFLSVIARKNK